MGLVWVWTLGLTESGSFVKGSVTAVFLGPTNPEIKRFAQGLEGLRIGGRTFSPQDGYKGTDF